MLSKLAVPFFLASIIVNMANSQTPACLSGPMEGYRGEGCKIERIPTSDGFVYTFSEPTKMIKKWSVETNQVVAEWPMTQPLGFNKVSHDGRYIQYTTQIASGFWSSRLFDTQTGKPVPIENMGVFAMLPNNIAVVRDEKRKVMLYDMTSGKIKETLGKDNGRFIDASADGNIIAWSEYDGAKVRIYDVAKKAVVLSEEVGRSEMPVSVSPNGRFVVWCGGIRDLNAGKTIKIDCYVNNLLDHQMLYAPDGKTGYSISSGKYSERGTWLGAVAYVREYNLETGAVVAEYNKTWTDNSRMPSYSGNLLGAMAQDGEHIYFPSKNGVVLVHKSDYAKQSKSLDFFGSIGAVGLAQTQAREQRAKHIEQLTVSAKKSFEHVIASNAFLQHNEKNYLYDYDPVSELIMVGNVFEGGLLDTKNGQFLATYSPEISRPGLSVKTNYPYASFALAPGGNLVAVISGDNAALYNRKEFVKDLKGVSILKLISEHLALAKNKSDMLGLFDLDKEQFLVTYRKQTERFPYILSPDKSKILIGDSKGSDVIDVSSGKVLRSFAGYGQGLTNKYIIADPWKPEFIDITTGNSVTVPGWDATRTGNKNFIDGSYIFYLSAGGVLDVYDVDNLKFASELPVKILGDLIFDYFAVLPNSQKLLVCTSNGYVSYTVDGKDNEFASAYTLNFKNGEISPFRFHISKAESNKIFAERNAQAEARLAARNAQANAGLPECMHQLFIKPNMVVASNSSGQMDFVQNYDCQTQKYIVESRVIMKDAVNVLTMEIPKFRMESEYKPVTASVCSTCNGSGTHMQTVQYNTTDVDNFNANVPGGKVITTKSGSFQRTEVCPVCKGAGFVK